MVTASSTSVPGNLEEDSHDLYRVMGMIADDLKDEIGITDYYVGGYSLGGTHTAYVSYVDAQGEALQLQEGGGDQSIGEPV